MRFIKGVLLVIGVAWFILTTVLPILYMVS